MLWLYKSTYSFIGFKVIHIYPSPSYIRINFSCPMMNSKIYVYITGCKITVGADKATIMHSVTSETMQYNIMILKLK